MAPAPEQLPPELQAQFTLLQQQFVAGLAARWQRIEQAADARSCHAELHRLAGAAGGYGHPALGQAARHAMQQFAPPDHASYPSDWDTLRDALRDALRAAGAVMP